MKVQLKEIPTSHHHHPVTTVVIEHVCYHMIWLLFAFLVKVYQRNCASPWLLSKEICLLQTCLFLFACCCCMTPTKHKETGKGNNPRRPTSPHLTYANKCLQ